MAAIVLVGEVASCENGRADRSEVARRDERHVRRGPLGRSGGALPDVERHPHLVAGQRQRHPEGRVGNARHRPQTFEQLVHEIVLRVGRIVRTGKLDPETEEILGVEAEVSTREIQETRRQHAGAAQQYQTDGDLGDDQPPASALLCVGAAA